MSVSSDVKENDWHQIYKAWYLIVQTIGNEFHKAEIMEANENLFSDVLPQVGCQQFGDSFRPSELLHRLGGLPLSASNILRRRTSCSNYELMLQSILSHSCHHRADAVSAAKV